MVENGFTEEGKSQEVMEDGRLSGNSRWCNIPRCRCFFLILLLASVLFLYNSNIRELAADWGPKWWMQYNSTKYWIPFKIATHPEISPTSGDFSENTTNSALDNASVAFTNETTNFSSSTPTETNRIANPETTKLTVSNTPYTGKTSPVTQLTTQNKTVLPTPVPYVSPGPYLVEYPSEYHFTINEPEKCKQLKPFVVLIVPLAPYNRAHRDIIRSTWGSQGTVLDKVVTLFFLLGQQTGEEAEQIQQKVLQESKEHRDLIQSDFLDCYKNLTIKTMVMMEWLDAHCSSASYAMKIDSDMFLNVDNLIRLLLKAPKSNYMTGLVARGAAVLRDPTSKWYLPMDIYPDPQYPRYALGLGYVLSVDLPKKLVEASRHVKALYIEDVYLGLCMRHLGIPPTDPPNWYYFHVLPLQYNRCEFSKIIATTTDSNTDLSWVWRDFKRPGSYC